MHSRQIFCSFEQMCENAICGNEPPVWIDQSGHFYIKKHPTWEWGIQMYSNLNHQVIERCESGLQKENFKSQTDVKLFLQTVFGDLGFDFTKLHKKYKTSCIIKGKDRVFVVRRVQFDEKAPNWRISFYSQNAHFKIKRISLEFKTRMEAFEFLYRNYSCSTRVDSFAIV